MRDLKKILKLRASNKSQRFIADSLKISNNTVSRIFSLADQKQLHWKRPRTWMKIKLNPICLGTIQ